MNGIGGLQFKASGIVFDMAHQPALAEPHATSPNDYSPYNHTIAFKGDGEPNWVQLPTGLWYMDFDGDDYVAISDHSSLDFGTGDFSIIMWVKRAAIGALHGLGGKKDSSHLGFELRVHSTDVLRCLIDDDVAVSILASTGKIVDTNWHLLGFLFDRDVGLIFRIDNTDAGTDTDLTATSGSISNSRSLFLGFQEYQTLYLTGNMALPRVYNYCPSTAVVDDIFTAEKWWFGV